MLAHGTVSDEVDLALCRSALYEALALGSRPPTEETAARLASAEGAAALGDAAGVLDAARSTGLAGLVRRLAPPPRPPPPGAPGGGPPRPLPPPPPRAPPPPPRRPPRRGNRWRPTPGASSATRPAGRFPPTRRSTG